MGDGRLQLGGDLHAEVAVLAGKAAVGDLAAVLLQQVVKALVHGVGVLHLHQQLLGGEGVRAHGEAVEDHLDGHQDGGLAQAQPVHARAHSHADGGGAPHAGGGGQTADRIAVFEDDAGAQEGYAADHLGGDTGRVGAPQAIHGPAVHKGVFGDDHKERGGAGDDAVGADARLLLPLAALQSHQRAQRCGQQQAKQEFQVIVCGE